jgi:hypothetical protein
MLFSLLTVAAFWLFWISVPADPREPGSWLSANSSTVALGLNLVPFAGIAFLWFIGVLRDRLGQLEDRFFATVFFFGSGLLFLGMLFSAAALVGAILMVRARRRLQHLEHIHDQDGLRIHDHHIDGRDLHGICAALVGGLGLCAVAAAAVRRLLPPLELRRFPIVGVSDQPLHSGGESSSADSGRRRRPLNWLQRLFDCWHRRGIEFADPTEPGPQLIANSASCRRPPAPHSGNR